MFYTGAATSERRNSNSAILQEETSLKFSKSQIKTLHEAMYHSAENNHLGKYSIAIKLKYHF